MLMITAAAAAAAILNAANRFVVLRGAAGLTTAPGRDGSPL